MNKYKYCLTADKELMDDQTKAKLMQIARHAIIHELHVYGAYITDVELDIEFRLDESQNEEFHETMRNLKSQPYVLFRDVRES